MRFYEPLPRPRVPAQMFYAPLYPPAYLLVAFAHVCSFWGTKFGICYWYRRPPALDDEIYTQLLAVLKWVLLLHIVIKLLALSAAVPGPEYLYGAIKPWLIALAGWLLYMVIPLKYTRCLRAYDQVDDEKTDTDGVRYDEVKAKKGYEIEKYVCPSAMDSKANAAQIFAQYHGRDTGASRSRKFNLDELQATKMTENNPGLPHAGLARFVPTRGKAKADMV